MRSDGSGFHRNDLKTFLSFQEGSDFLVGHNIFRHDLNLIAKTLGLSQWRRSIAIDTLLLSPLLFPAHPYHRLLKDKHFLPEELNDPLEDARKSMDLFYEEVAAFKSLDERLQRIFTGLLAHQEEFSPFFRYLELSPLPEAYLVDMIRLLFDGQICAHVALTELIRSEPVALAYALALIRSGDKYSITPPWVVHTSPKVEPVIRQLRNEPCTGCPYCNQWLAALPALQRFFKLDSYRTFDGVAMQEEAVTAAIRHESLLAVFPTGGGKSITFQVPALLSGEAARALTVIISPLQSLMKDQVDNLARKGITDAVTINGLLDPIERQKAIERVQGTSPDISVAHLLYISPESLRSVTIERLLMGRKIARFVIDEAHCFSTWGQDFRVDYLYIGEFLRNLQEKKGLQEPIPVSCFTATAKPQVIEDIQAYFQNKLGIRMRLFQASVARKNLQYRVVAREGEENKYAELRRLIGENSCPTIVYVSRTKRAAELAERLTTDGYSARAYHGKMERDERVASQDAFLGGEVDVMVATSAFGMGVDKDNVGRVIHYNLSDSLENYVQEAGRAGRSEKIQAECHVLFDEEDLDKHFALLNMTKLDVKEINQIWRAVKQLTSIRNPKICLSALEIARKAGWDEGIHDLETRVKTAIAALEEAKLVERGKNAPQVFANSILTKNMEGARQRIETSDKIQEVDKEPAVRIMKKLFSSKSKSLASDEAAESRIDYISDHLAIRKEEIIRIINLLREEKILADARDLTAFVRRQDGSKNAQAVLKSFRQLETCLVSLIEDGEHTYSIKDWMEVATEAGCADVAPAQVRTLLNFWAVRNFIRKRSSEGTSHYVTILMEHDQEQWRRKMERRHEMAGTILNILFEKAAELRAAEGDGSADVLVEFSVLELKEALLREAGLFGTEPTIEDIEDTLFYLTRIEALKIEGGFLVSYQRIRLERIEPNNAVKYGLAQYAKLAEHYKNKAHQIHIVGEYARRMLENYEEALTFTNDYFRLPYDAFLRKYFRGRAEDLKRTMTPARFETLFGQLSPAQLAIIKERDQQQIVVVAGPGSGKTRVLVHKLASILLTEDVRYEQMLMLTFSRAAASEFKKRLVALIGKDAHHVEIKTFHSYCFDLLGRNGNLAESEGVIRAATERILAGEVEQSRITKAILVVDEAQDMNAEEYELLQAIIAQNEDIRVLLVGDDDQSIYGFRKAGSEFMQRFLSNGAFKFDLVENYRSCAEIVSVANQWAAQLQHRLKELPIVAVRKEPGQIRITKHSSGSLVVPLTKELKAGKDGTTCVLTFENKEAEIIAGYLAAQGIPTRLIQSADKIALNDLRELRHFSDTVLNSNDNYTILPDDWLAAKADLRAKFARSIQLERMLAVIDEFELLHPDRRYKSDWQLFLKESKWEDFVQIEQNIVYVSTIHKAKGREFDKVLIALQKFTPDEEEKKRLLYVAMTRAKNELSVHYRADYLQSFAGEGVAYLQDQASYPGPEVVSYLLNYHDVFLSFFSRRQDAIHALHCGDELSIYGNELHNSRGITVLRFSASFTTKIDEWQSRGYRLDSARVLFMAYWKGQEATEETLIFFPEVRFEKSL
ncbi:RecQ family ATP-dependent DNA helicase [Flaviaesturariibacter amylovorans]|uniref:DNA 3'-5' helicase n=2 Tax=Flaviaesturariibacter amylovorans TaxID=1084520 RepID=A0ABP8HHU0_9BACT